MHPDDVRVPQRGRDIGLAIEPLPNSLSEQTDADSILSASRRGSLGCWAR